MNESEKEEKLTRDGQDITRKSIQVGKRSPTAQPPLDWIASVEILLRELPELKKFIDWHTRLSKSHSEILLQGMVEIQCSLTGWV
jgi:hypothetical protein